MKHNATVEPALGAFTFEFHDGKLGGSPTWRCPEPAAGAGPNGGLRPVSLLMGHLAGATSGSG